MENKAHAIVAGVFTLLLLAAVIFVALWLNRDRVNWVPYQIATKFSIPGLSPQAAVRYRGLTVGKVDEITFDPQQPGQILVNISVRPDTPITKSTYASLGYQGVTGIAYVQLDDDGSQPVKLPSSPEHVARISMQPSLLDQLQNRGLAILKQTEEIASRINGMLTTQNQEAILAAFNNVSKAAIQIETIPRQLQPTLAKLPAMANQAQRTLQSLDALARQTGELSGNLNRLAVKLQAPGGALDTFTDSAAQIGAVANRIEHEAVPVVGDMRASLRALNRTLESINERPQSVLLGPATPTPGPGEPGFTVPTSP